MLNIANRPGNLPERIEKALMISFATAEDESRKPDGTIEEVYAYNEVSVFRATRQAAKLRITVDKETRPEELIADGVLFNACGSTAYTLCTWSDQPD